MQFKNLIKKRFIYTRKDKGSLSCEIFVPLVLILIGLLLTTTNFIKDSE